MVELFNEDCFCFLSKIEDGSIDLVLIDPPYEISTTSGFSSSKETGRDTDRFRKYITDFGEWDKKSNFIDVCIKELHRVLRAGGTLICFYDLWKITLLKEWMENAKFKQIRFIEWQKTNPVPINSKVNYLTNSREIALSAVKGAKPTFNSRYDNGVYCHPICHEKGRFHPTQKPLKLFEEIVLKHSNEGDIVLDCFSGSGTTAVASIITNRRFTGCEYNKEYFDKSMKRIAEVIN